MTTSTDATAGDATVTTSPVAARSYRIVIGLAALTVLLQGLWAGLFIHEGKDYSDKWVQVHARGADVAIVLSLIALVVAVARFRPRKDLIVGTAVLLVVLVIESFLGGLIGNSPNVTVIHIPLAMALMGLSVWLPLRARSL